MSTEINQPCPPFPFPPLSPACVAGGAPFVREPRGDDRVNGSLSIPSDTFLAARSRLLMQPSRPQHWLSDVIPITEHARTNPLPLITRVAGVFRSSDWQVTN